MNDRVFREVVDAASFTVDSSLHPHAPRRNSFAAICLLFATPYTALDRLQIFSTQEGSENGGHWGPTSKATSQLLLSP